MCKVLVSWKFPVLLLVFSFSFTPTFPDTSGGNGYWIPRSTPLLNITGPLINISTHYCYKITEPLVDWEETLFYIEKVLSYDTTAHNTPGLLKIADVLKKCAAFTRGQPDWAGPGTLVFINLEPLKEPSKFSQVIEYVKNLPTNMRKLFKISERRKKRDVRIGKEAVKVIRMMREIMYRACRPDEHFPIDRKYYAKLEELMENGMQLDLVRYQDSLYEKLKFTIKTMETCLADYTEKYLEFTKENNKFWNQRVADWKKEHPDK